MKIKSVIAIVLVSCTPTLMAGEIGIGFDDPVAVPTPIDTTSTGLLESLLEWLELDSNTTE